MRTRICLSFGVSLVWTLACIGPSANAALQFTSLASGDSAKIIEKYAPFRGQKDIVDPPHFPGHAHHPCHSRMDPDPVYTVAKAIKVHAAEPAAINPQGAEYELEDATDGAAIRSVRVRGNSSRKKQNYLI